MNYLQANLCLLCVTFCWSTEVVIFACIPDTVSPFAVTSITFLVGVVCVVVCMMARDRRAVDIAYQMPLYPMLDNFDTDSSADNHGKIWNTSRNHMGWRLYLRKDAKKEVSPYAAPARQTDFSGLPPCYTFVGDGEPFYRETLTYVENLRAAGIEAECDVFHSNTHAFDMLYPERDISKEAADRFIKHFAYAKEHYFTKIMQG